MKIAFHGNNATNFRTGLTQLLHGPHETVDLNDKLDQPDEQMHFTSADVNIGTSLSAAEPKPLKVRLYHAPAAGVDAIDVSRLPPGATLCNCFGHEDAIAEYVFAALLQRHVPIADADRNLRQGEWTYWAGRPGALRTELGGQTMGLLGFGHIGNAIAARAKAFGKRVVVSNRSMVAASRLLDKSYGLHRLAEFRGASDNVVVSLPLTESTQGIANAAALKSMRADAVIVNVGRGPVIDEVALYDALKTRRIGGAIIDTWYSYPSQAKRTCLPSTLPFHELTNLIMPPHMSGQISSGQGASQQIGLKPQSGRVS